MVWPERTGFSTKSELGSGGGCVAFAGAFFCRRFFCRRFFCRRFFPRRLRYFSAGGGPAAGQHGRQAGPEGGRVHALDSHDADIARIEILNQASNLLRAQLRMREVKHRGTSDEKAGGTSDRRVEIDQPVRKRQLRRQREGEVRSTAEMDGTRTGLAVHCVPYRDPQLRNRQQTTPGGRNIRQLYDHATPAAKEPGDSPRVNSTGSCRQE